MTDPLRISDLKDDFTTDSALTEEHLQRKKVHNERTNTTK